MRVAGKLDPMFLMEILELREAIEELPGADTCERGQSSAMWQPAMRNLSRPGLA